jgi:hypothetical protein
VSFQKGRHALTAWRPFFVDHRFKIQKCVLIAPLMRPSSSMTAIQRHLSKVVQG